MNENVYDNHGMPKQEVQALIISCMDGRLNFKIDQLRLRTNAITLRNAGANLADPEMRKAIYHVLKEHDIKLIMLLPHVDCGAMGLVASTLLEHKSVDPAVYSELVQQFKGRFHNRRELEEHLNPDIQVEALKELIGDRQITINLSVLDPSKLNVPEDYGKHEHTLFVAKPYTSRCEFMFEDAAESVGREVGMWGTYVVQPASRVSQQIAIENLGIKRAVFYAKTEGDKHDAIRAAHGLQTAGYAKGVDILIANPNHVKRKVF